MIYNWYIHAKRYVDWESSNSYCSRGIYNFSFQKSQLFVEVDWILHFACIFSEGLE